MINEIRPCQLFYRGFQSKWTLMLPDEQCGCYQHHGQVHRHRRLEVEPLEVGGGVADTDEEERGQECCQQLIS